MQPVFLFSLPRSGSTLLQRMIAGHSSVATAPEPWLLLALAGLRPDDDLARYSEYSHRGARAALQDFVSCMPNGRATYDAILRDAAMRMYAAASSTDARYFLDKTPRYFLIIDFILDLFPDSPAILLTRNPLDVLASILTTWGGGRLWIHHALLDLYRGPLLLHDALARHRSRFLIVDYERLVRQPRVVCEEICAHLGVDYEESMLASRSDVVLGGLMGDKSSNIRRPEVVTDSVGRWREVLATPVRRRFAFHYLDRLGPDVLASFGVDAAALREEIRSMPVKWRQTVPDLALLLASFAGPAVAATVIRNQWRDHRRFPMVKLD